jgi:hypothetical protein
VLRLIFQPSQIKALSRTFHQTLHLNCRPFPPQRTVGMPCSLSAAATAVRAIAPPACKALMVGASQSPFVRAPPQGRRRRRTHLLGWHYASIATQLLAGVAVASAALVRALISGFQLGDRARLPQHEAADGSLDLWQTGEPHVRTGLEQTRWGATERVSRSTFKTTSDALCSRAAASALSRAARSEFLPLST